MLSNKSFIIILLFISFVPICIISAPPPNDEIDTIRERVLELIVWPKPENISYLVERVL